jgi:hypothetical protein
MQFCYVESKINGAVSFSDAAGSISFSMETLTPGEKLNESKIYILSDTQYILVRDVVFSRNDIELVSANDYVNSNSLFKSMVIGSGSFNDSFVVSNCSIAEAIQFWKSKNKDGVSLGIIGGFGSDPVYSIASSTIFSRCIETIYTESLTAGVDLLVDNVRSNYLGPHLHPVNTISSLPVTLDFINKYDGLWICDDDSLNIKGVNNCKNYFDFFMSVYGCEPYHPAPLFVLDNHIMDLMFATISSMKENPSQRVVCIDLDGFVDEAKIAIFDNLKLVLGGSLFVTLSDDKFYVENNVVSMVKIVDSASKKGAFFSCLDCYVAGSSENIYIASCFNVPTILLSRMSSRSEKYKYFYNLITVLNCGTEKSDNRSIYEYIIAGNFIKGVWFSHINFSTEPRVDISEPVSNLVDSNTNLKDKSSSYPVNRLVRILSLTALSLISAIGLILCW